MIHLGDVQVFLAIVQEGSFSGAARRLAMAKTSLTRQLARLEKQLSCQLLVRTTRHVRLTDQGRDFLPHARRLLDDGMEAESLFRNQREGARGTLTVGATVPFAWRFLIPHLAAFHARNRHLRIAMWLSSGRAEIGSGVGQVDIAIRLRNESAPDIATRRLGEINFWLFAAKTYLDARAAPRQPAELEQHQVIELGPPSKANQLILTQGGKSATVRYTPIAQMDDPDAVLAAVEAGLGIAALPAFAAVEGVRAGRLIRVLSDWQMASVPVSVLYRADAAPPLRIRAYVDFLFETVGSTQPWAITDEDLGEA